LVDQRARKPLQTVRKLLVTHNPMVAAARFFGARPFRACRCPLWPVVGTGGVGEYSLCSAEVPDSEITGTHTLWLV
jgi:hypothetical protein